jgi:hypothetical protein
VPFRTGLAPARVRGRSRRPASESRWNKPCRSVTQPKAPPNRPLSSNRTANGNSEPGQVGYRVLAVTPVEQPETSEAIEVMFVYCCAAERCSPTPQLGT